MIKDELALRTSTLEAAYDRLEGWVIMDYQIYGLRLVDLETRSDKLEHRLKDLGDAELTANAASAKISPNSSSDSDLGKHDGQ